MRLQFDQSWGCFVEYNLKLTSDEAVTPLQKVYQIGALRIAESDKGRLKSQKKVSFSNFFNQIKPFFKIV